MDSDLVAVRWQLPNSHAILSNSLVRVRGWLLTMLLRQSGEGGFD